MRKLFVFFGGLVAVFMFLGLVSRASAASYDVSASVPFPAPTVAATIDSSLNGSTKTTDVTEIFGTCQPVSPVSVISIWREGSLLGSVNCEANGTFRLSVILLPGVNNLTVKTSNLSGNYGPDSIQVRLVYLPPTVATNSASGGQSSDLTISTPNPFEILTDGNTVTVQVVVSGGTSPYVVTLNWGDGTTETLNVKGPGTYPFKHTYTAGGVYKVIAMVTDVLGVTKIHQFIVSSLSPAGQNQSSQPTVTGTKDKGIKGYLIVSGVVAGVLVIALIFLSSFWLGRRYQNKKLTEELGEFRHAKELAKKHKR